MRKINGERTLEQSQQSDEYICKSCGAKLEYMPNTQALQCPYCGNKVDIASRQEVPHFDDSRFVIPMTIDERKLKNAAYEYMFSQEDAPDDILDQATFTTARLRYVPCYIFSGHYQATWSASFGYDRTESYIANGKTRIRTVTDWRPASGQDVGDFAVVSYAGESLPSDVSTMIERSSGFEDLRHYDSAYLINAEIDDFSITSEEIYQKDGVHKVNQIIDQNVHQHAQGDRQRDWNWNGSIQKTSTPVMVPVGQITFDYKDHEYTVWCDGVDDKNFTGDTLPKDTVRSRKIYMGHIPWLGTLIGGGIGYSLFKETLNWFVFIVPIIIMFLFWVFRRASIRRYSRKLKQRSLTHYQISNNLSHEDPESISQNLKIPEKPFLLSITTYDFIILPLLPLLCFGASYELQKVFPYHVKAKKVKAVSSSMNHIPNKTVSQMVTNNSSESDDQQKSMLNLAIKNNKQLNQEFTKVWKRLSAKKQTTLMSKLRESEILIEKSCSEQTDKATGEIVQQTAYYRCANSQLKKLTADIKKYIK